MLVDQCQRCRKQRGVRTIKWSTIDGNDCETTSSSRITYCLRASTSTLVSISLRDPTFSTLLSFLTPPRHSSPPRVPASSALQASKLLPMGESTASPTSSLTSTESTILKLHLKSFKLEQLQPHLQVFTLAPKLGSNSNKQSCREC